MEWGTSPVTKQPVRNKSKWGMSPIITQHVRNKTTMLLLHISPSMSSTEPKGTKKPPNTCCFPKDDFLISYLFIRKYLFPLALHRCLTYCPAAGEEPMESPINRSVRAGVRSGRFSPLGTARQSQQRCQRSPIWVIKFVVP